MFSSAWYGAWLRREGARGGERETEKKGKVSWSLQLWSGFIIRHVCACWESVIDDALPPIPTNTHTHRKTHALYGAITSGPLIPYICCVCAFRAPLVQDSVNNCWMDRVFTAIYSGSSVGWCCGWSERDEDIDWCLMQRITPHLVQCLSKHYAQYV